MNMNLKIKIICLSILFSLVFACSQNNKDNSQSNFGKNPGNVSSENAYNGLNDAINHNEIIYDINEGDIDRLISTVITAVNDDVWYLGENSYYCGYESKEVKLEIYRNEENVENFVYKRMKRLLLG
ncbi:MAG TPA: hypothetical protein PLK32_09260, partial [Defluviitoga tunisiensis]|nr:hypothetical protein [Defluviitoga tunisiensis]